LRRALVLLDDRVVQRLEIPESVELGDARADLVDVERLADERLHLGENGPLVAPRLRIDANEFDHGEPGLARRTPRRVGAVGILADGERREP
jgi:hypothetical protein